MSALRARDADVVSIRPARVPDISSIARIWHEGWRDAHLGRVPDALLRHRDGESFGRRAGDRLDDVRLAEANGDPAGFVRVKGDELEQIFVDRRHRGGAVAPALMCAGERLLASRGIATAFLVVNPKNARAVGFYEKGGWSRIGLADYAAEIGEGTFTMPLLRFEKSVLPPHEDR